MIYIIANANCTSGGPELLHQCCNKLNELGFEAVMVYFSGIHFGVDASDRVKERYERYNCKTVHKVIDKKENTVILAEGILYLLPKFKKIKKVIWWLSVDNYFASFNVRYAKFYAPLGMNSKKHNPFSNNYLHCCQSEYAKMFLKKHSVADSQIIDLFDFLSAEFIEKTVNEAECQKYDHVLYNPKKGFEFTQRLIEAAPGVKWIALEKMSRDEMVETMTHAKIYVDFGNHPGKDRIPREAAMCGCVVITGKRGSAKNDVDIPVPNEYKYEDTDENIPAICEMIHSCFETYQERRHDFDEYRSVIRSEEDEFCQQIKLLGRLLNDLR